MSSRQQNAGLTTLYVLLFAQVVCFFLNAVDNFFAVFSLTFVGHKGAALAKPVVQINNIVLIGHTLMWFYLVCCLIFFFLPVGLSQRKTIFFYILILLDAISLWLGLYGYYFWMTGGADLAPMERAITLIEPLLSSGGLILLIAVPAVRDIWWPRRR
jgi:hypothetical protein